MRMNRYLPAADCSTRRTAFHSMEKVRTAHPTTPSILIWWVKAEDAVRSSAFRRLKTA